MGSRDNTFNFVAPVDGLSRVDNIRQDVDIGTVRVNYTFGGPGIPVY